MLTMSENILKLAVTTGIFCGITSVLWITSVCVCVCVRVCVCVFTFVLDPMHATTLVFVFITTVKYRSVFGNRLTITLLSFEMITQNASSSMTQCGQLLANYPTAELI
jgi:hypothetical protein